MFRKFEQSDKTADSIWGRPSCQALGQKTHLAAGARRPTAGLLERDASARRNQGEFDSFISIEVWQETFRESRVNSNCSSKSYFGFNIYQTSVHLSKEMRGKFCVDSD